MDATNQVTNPQGNKPVGTIIGIAIHHSVTTMSPAASVDQELEHIRAIDRVHVGQNFGGFGYHLAAFASGRSYLCGDLGGQRAHVARRNHELIGIVAIGDFSTGLPAEPQLQAIRDCIDAVRIVYGDLPIRGHNTWALPGEGTVCAGLLNGFNWNAAPVPAPSPLEPTNGQAAHALHFAYVAYYSKNLAILHPFDRLVVQRIAEWTKG